MLTPEQMTGEAESQIIAVFMAKSLEKSSGYAFAQYRAVQKYDLHPDLVPADEDAKLLFTAHGPDLPADKMKKVLLVGHWQTDTKTGRITFRVKTSLRAPLASREDIAEYMRSFQCGIADETAQRILNAYGSESLDMLKNHPEEVVALFKGARRSSIFRLQSCIAEDEALKDIVDFLARAGLATEYAQHIYTKLGVGAIQSIRENPYILSLACGCAFEEVDHSAMALGMAPTHTKRLAGALYNTIAALQNDEGHVCINPGFLKERVLRLLNHDARACVPDGAVQAVIEHEIAGKNLIAAMGMLYPAADFVVERNLAMMVANLLKCPSDDELADKAERAIIRWQQRNPGIVLDKKQIEAILLLRHPFAAITGGPGMGKTTILRAIIEIYHEILPDAAITLMAPTGQAASRMREAIGELGKTASTIHKGLHIIPYDEFLSTNHKLMPGLVITDEYSMVSQALAHAQLSSLDAQKEYCFLMVGDVHQLPSIDPGDVLRHFIKCGRIPSVQLDVVYRQGESSSIPSNCQCIVDSVHKMVFDNSFCFHEVFARERDAVNQEVCGRIQELYQKGIEAFGENQTVVLSPFRRHGLLATRQLNPLLRDQRVASRPPSAGHTYQIGHTVFRVGDKVVQTTRNNGKISNGDTGFILEISPSDAKRRTVTIDFQHCIAEYGYEEMKHVELGYALSVHQAQGCQFDYVVIPMVKNHKRMLYNNLLLTAVSRAAKQVHLVGEKEAFRLAVSQRPPKRGSMLADLIVQYLDSNSERSSTHADKCEPSFECRQITLAEYVS